MSNAGLKGLLSAVVAAALCFAAPLHAKGYRATLHHWTRSKQLFSTTDVQVKVLAHATYFSPQFRKAFIAQHLKKKYLEGPEAGRFLEEQEREAAKGQEFFVGMYSPKPYRAFTSGKDSFWEAVLITEKGEVLKPLLVSPVEVTPYERVMFPYLTRWTKGYRVVFPKATLGKEFQLTLRSVIGETHLWWD